MDHLRRYATSAQSSEKGAALVEFAIIAAGILFGFLIFFDTGMAICNYFALSGIASEGIKYGGRIPELETLTASNHQPSLLDPPHSDQDACDRGIPRPNPAYPCGHYFLHRRLVRAASLVELSLANDTIDIVSERKPGVAGGGFGAERDTVSLRLSGTFQGLLLRLPLRTEAQGPYLF